MKRFFSGLSIAAAIIIGGDRVCWAFHDGGVAECEGCHTMHNSLDGAAMSPAALQFQARPYLLQGETQSSTCLKCHEQAGDVGPTSFHVSTPSADMPQGSPPRQMTPAGDFGWLKKSYTWQSGETGGQARSKGDRHGHNIIAPDFGYNADASQQYAPGGASSYPAAELHCSSCHDPHGRYRVPTNPAPVIGTNQSRTGKPIYGSGSYGDLPTALYAVGTYRLLAGKDYYPKSMDSGYKFLYPAPVAVAPADYNRSEATSETRVAYGKGMTNWCANCHEAMHGAIYGNTVHPADQALGSEIASNYNSYKMTGDITGNGSTAYTSLVPYTIDGSGDLVTLKNTLMLTSGPSSSDRVMCLSCHRVHASGWDSILRWNVNTTFMTVALADGSPEYPGTDNPGSNADTAQGRTKAETRGAYYDRPAAYFAGWQRSYCNKCHVKD